VGGLDRPAHDRAALTVPHTWAVDGARIDLLAEDVGAYNSLHHDLPELADMQHPEALAAGALDGTSRLVLSFHGYVVRTADRCVVIDTCVGNDKSLSFRPAWHRKSDTRYHDGLTAASIAPAQVDLVINTHLHLDHVGWNTTWSASDGWRPTFPNARYVIVENEYRHAHERAARTEDPLAPLHATSLAENVDPLLELGLVDLVAADHVVTDDVRLLPTPGHTRDHVAVAVGRGRDAAVFTGDLLHSPVQLAHPDARWTGDEDGGLAAASRREFLDRYADSSTLVCTMHCPAPPAGWLRSAGNGFRLDSAARLPVDDGTSVR
jgi:glyoxylase-like metal-dependent hydrolase (beta-lactamase superfamily II)